MARGKRGRPANTQRDREIYGRCRELIGGRRGQRARAFHTVALEFGLADKTIERIYDRERNAEAMQARQAHGPTIRYEHPDRVICDERGVRFAPYHPNPLFTRRKS